MICSTTMVGEGVDLGLGGGVEWIRGMCIYYIVT